MAARLEYTSEHHRFRQLVHDFVQRTVVPNHEDWQRDGQWDRSLFIEAGKLGLLGFSVPEHLGGPGVDDFRYNAIVIDELQRAGAASEAIAFNLQNDIVLPYLTDLTTPQQQQRWLPGVVTGKTVLGIAMSEPGTGSDLAGIRTTAVRDGDHYVINGAKTFISNGQSGDLFVIAVRTSPKRHKGLSLLVVDADTPGFHRGRNLGQDRLARPGHQRAHLHRYAGTCRQSARTRGHGVLPAGAQFAAGAARTGSGRGSRRREHRGRDARLRPRSQGVRLTDRQLPAQPIRARRAGDRNRYRPYLSRRLPGRSPHRFTDRRTGGTAEMVDTDLQVRTADRCLQPHSGYGYMREYSVSRAFVDARIQTIYGGTNEIMKTIIAKDLGI